jgi:integration host factor subunit beta
MPENDAVTITKKELVNRIAEETGQTKVVVKNVLQRFLDEIIEELAQGNRLEFREFGVFEVRMRAARQAQNPRTLEKVVVPEKRVVKFKVGRQMRQRVCGEGEPVTRRRGRAQDSQQSPAPGPEQTEPPQPPASDSPF